MLSKYGDRSRLLKINRLFLQIKSGRILDILWAFLIKHLFHSRLLDMTKIIIANSAPQASLAVYS